MYLHIGNDIIIPYRDIIAIINLETAREAGGAKKKEPGAEEYKSMLVTDSRVYYSTISSGTLMKRADLLFKNPDNA